MKFNQLKYFIELVRSKNFSEAARVLKISQPALSLQMQKLEEEYDFKLFERTKKPMALTREGEMFYEKALQIVQLVEDLDQLGLDLEEKVEGKLRVGIIPTLSPYLVPLFMDTMKEQYPQLKLHIEELKTEEIIDELAHAGLDLGIISTPVKAKNTGFVPLFYERFFIYISENHPLYAEETLNLNQLNFDELWYLHEGNCFQNQVNSVCQMQDLNNSELPFQYVSNSIESLKRIVENQGGMTFIPELATSNIPAEYENMIKEFANSAPTRQISAVYLKTTGLKKTASAFLDVLLSKIPGRMQAKPQTQPIDTKIRL
ncbi:LysR family transcriptional regulator [Mangrovibacterium diazotrophicum]|uniref:LysR family hydrogen peroxide-inducible transcriptional activator n=1 Tax=Mangrovibacterium diazotrophicum TaxID=1261403 RepID=A0A419VWX3_9BACT|nr:hydrogen peroxide-inducible genes activator [Mangrovibacterium diazotrophicum]RKD87731.1 LysR family hydrogen peroxide-inducible transcriptional activator [Mangrovibacterium diazotrophicum]